MPEPRIEQPVQKFSWSNLGGASSPQALSGFYRAEREKWGRIMREVGIEPM